MEVQAEYDYTASEEDELNLKVGDIVTNVTKVMDGWCEGYLNGKKGLFPENFVKVKESKKPDKPKEAPQKRQNAPAVAELRTKLSSVIGMPPQAGAGVPRKPIKKAKVTFAYAPQNDDELALELGQIIDVLKQDEVGWWEGNLNGKIGMFPSNFVEIIEKSESTGTEETSAPEIVGRKVPRVGFGNIFGGDNKIVLKSKGDRNDAADPTAKERPPLTDPKVTKRPGMPPQPVKEETKPVVRAKVLYHYSAANGDELSLNEGEVVIVLDQHLEDQGWWKGELNGKVGVFPDNFVEILPADEKIRKLPGPSVVQPSNGAMKGQEPKVPPVAENKFKFKKAEPTAPVLKPAIADPVKPTLETDDHKAKTQGISRVDTINSVKTTSESLSHPTADRIRPPPVRRPPTNPAGMPSTAVKDTSEQKAESVFSPPVKPSAQPQMLNVKEDPKRGNNEPNRVGYLQNDAGAHPSNDQQRSNFVTRDQYTELQKEVERLRDQLDQTKKAHEKRFLELMQEIDDEKKVRMNLQVEIDRIKRLVTSN